ncbi:conserved hypothetical protein [gamma proteobacterium HTCC5015]|nr:conserved hypothetical protein [gamma proteobacterium HTCC5015]
MPDHLHWLLQLNHEPLETVVGRVKAVTSKRIGLALWQSGFYDQALRQSESPKNLARYIVANPLRAHLVQSIGDYPHWDVAWL